MSDKMMLSWSLQWLDAGCNSAAAALAAGTGGQAHGALAVIALRNAQVAIEHALGRKHNIATNLSAAVPDLKNTRDMLSHFEEYALGKGRLQGPARAAMAQAEAADPGSTSGKVAWALLWNGSTGGDDGSRQSLSIFTHLDGDGLPTFFDVNLQSAISAIATAIVAAYAERGGGAPEWVQDLV